VAPKWKSQQKVGRVIKKVEKHCSKARNCADHLKSHLTHLRHSNLKHRKKHENRKKLFELNVYFARILIRFYMGTRLFGLVDLVRAVSVWGHFGQTTKSCRNLSCSHFNADILKSTRSFIKKKLQTWSKIQQLISIYIWFSLSPASKLNHYRHFAIKYKFLKVIITIQI